MKSNRHPADELADVRGRIWALKAREAELRGVLLCNVDRHIGDENRVIVRRNRRRVFQKDRLPRDILSNPAFWDETEATHVVIEPRGNTGRTPQTAGSPPSGLDHGGRGDVDDALFRRVTGRWPDG